MSQPGEEPEVSGGVLARLDGLEDVPLADQVEIFQTIHDELAARLDGAED